MTVTTSYPGVYIEEDSSTTISVMHLATAVPVFIVSDDSALFVKSGADIIKVVSWLDYRTQVLAITGNDVNFEDNMVDVNTRAYFECGGSTCYFVTCSNAVTVIPEHDDITIVVSDDPSYNDVANQLCYSGSGLFAILDGPKDKVTSDYVPSDSYSANSCAAIYYPYLHTDWTSHNISSAVIMAGIFCQSDRTRGVWKSPANIVIPAGYKPNYKPTETLQGIFNSGLAINMIRYQRDRGLCVMGARTLEDSDQWRYISVRRLFDSVEHDIKSMMNTLMFEMNTPPTWSKVKNAIVNYLHGLWKQGALMGSSEQDAFFVQIGKDITMSDDDINQGKMIAKVGLAAVRPAEFIIITFSQNVVSLL